MAASKAPEPQLVDFGDGFSAYTFAEYEARFIYNEIFTENCYDVEQFSGTPFMVDVGANIGMFSMYMKRKYPNAKILAFEPAPPTYKTLQRNLELHKATDVRTYQCALGAQETTDTLTFYPECPGNSTFVPAEKEIMKQLIPEEFKAQMDHAFASYDKVEVPIKRLSDFLRAEGITIDKIDLLKIDVEGREIDVCKGLDDEDWAKVRNVVLEVFDVGGALEVTEKFIKSKGFETERELAIKGQDDPSKPKIYNIMCRRRKA